MRSKPLDKARRTLRYGFSALVILLLLACGLSAPVNISLPKRSQVGDHLSSLEKARLAEFFHLKQALGNEIWPGWGDAQIPSSYTMKNMPSWSATRSRRRAG